MSCFVGCSVLLGLIVIVIVVLSILPLVGMGIAGMLNAFIMWIGEIWDKVWYTISGGVDSIFTICLVWGFLAACVMVLLSPFIIIWWLWKKK